MLATPELPDDHKPQTFLHIASIGILLGICIFYTMQFGVRQLKAISVATDFVFFYPIIGMLILLTGFINGLMFWRNHMLWILGFGLIIALTYATKLDTSFMLIRFLADPISPNVLFFAIIIYVSAQMNAHHNINNNAKNNSLIFILTTPFILLPTIFADAFISLLAAIIATVFILKNIRQNQIKNSKMHLISGLLIGGLFATAFISFALNMNSTETLAGMTFLVVIAKLLTIKGAQKYKFGLLASKAFLVATMTLLIAFCLLLFISIPTVSPILVLIISGIFLALYFNSMGKLTRIMFVSLIPIFIIFLGVGGQISSPSMFQAELALMQSRPMGMPDNVQNAPLYVWTKMKSANMSSTVEHDASVHVAGTNSYMFFGADTHGKDSNNNVSRFNLDNQTWGIDQPSSPSWFKARNFEVGQFVPALRSANQRPVAQHTYGQTAWLKSEKCMAVLGGSFHHLPMAFLPNRPQVTKLWCYDPVKIKWRILDQARNAPRLFSGSLIANTNGDTLYALGHINTENGLLPIGGESSQLRQGLYKWQQSDASWTPILPALDIGPQITSLFDTKINQIITIEKGGRVIRSIDPVTKIITTLALNEKCVQSHPYPPITATKGEAGEIYFLVRRGKNTLLCLINKAKDIEFIKSIPKALSMNFHLHYIGQWKSLLIFQSDSDKPKYRTAWIMRVNEITMPVE